MNRDPSLFEITAMVKKVEDVDAVRQAIERTIESSSPSRSIAQKLDD